MKLVLVISSLSAGGAERVMSILANYWAEKGWEIVLLTFDDGSVPPFFPLDPRVCHRPLALLQDSATPMAAITNNLSRLVALRRAIRRENPAAVISFLDTVNILTLLATLGLSIPVIVSERIHTERHRIKPIWRFLRRWVYPRAARVVLLTERALDCFPAAVRARCRVIPNPVLPVPGGGVQEIEPPSGKLVVAMGRLDRQKGFDLLLEAFARLVPRFPDWSLVILGEGELRPALEDLRARLGLAGKVFLPGSVREPRTILRRSDLFVLSSRFEGFPNALCEAMAAGLPVVAADCPTGPREIIRNGIDGILVPPENSALLAEAMERLMADEAERRRLGACASDIVNRFSRARIMGQWEELLKAARAEREGCRRFGGQSF